MCVYLFVAFPWVETNTGPGGFYYMTGTPEGSTESGFMEKPGFEPATPGLQGIALIHYTTGDLCVYLMTGATEGSTEGQKTR